MKLNFSQTIQEEIAAASLKAGLSAEEYCESMVLYNLYLDGRPLRRADSRRYPPYIWQLINNMVNNLKEPNRFKVFNQTKLDWGLISIFFRNYFD